MRSIIFRIFFYAALTTLGLGLFQSQVIEGRRYRAMSEQNRIRLIPTEAPRGRVFDSVGNLLATNRPSYDVVATPEDIEPSIYPYLSKILNVPEKELRGRMRAAREYPFAPALIKEDVGRDIAFKIEERRPELPGVDIRISFLRSYPYNQTASHLIGYIGKVSPEEYKSFDNKNKYGLNSLIGRAGIEKVFDEKLRGVRGGRQIEVNAKGQLMRVLSEQVPEPGTDVTLTINLDLQSKVMEAIKDKRASVVMMDLKTQGLTILASNPGFDPNAFVAPGRGKERMAYLKDTQSPLLDRGVGASYPPGSVFKLVTSLAALEKGKTNQHTRFNCRGEYRMGTGGGGHTFHCWYKRGHGNLNMYQAIERSCNVYFYNLGRILDADDIAKTSHIFGLGEPMSLEVTNVSPGLVPDTNWKQEKLKQKWYEGETLSFAIGQGYLLTSPLQILRMVSIIAKDGKKVEPHILSDTVPPAEPGSVNIKKENLEVIKKSMLQVIHSDFGTGQLARLDWVKTAAKTGTAQAPPKTAHSWMAGFFPYENPKYSFVIFVENGGSGGITCAKIMKDIMKSWKELNVYPLA